MTSFAYLFLTFAAVDGDNVLLLVHQMTASDVITTKMRRALCFCSFAALHGQITSHAYCFISACTTVLDQREN